MQSKTEKTLHWITIIASALGMAVAGYLLYFHFANPSDAFCDINERFNCTAVNQSKYAFMFGLPVAGIGLAGYLAIFLLALLPKTKLQWQLPFAASVLGVVFQGHLTYIELFELKAVCIMCVASQILILALAVVTGILYFKNKKQTVVAR